MIRRAAHPFHVEIRFERIDLTPEGVALYGNVHHRGERVWMPRHVFREEDRARAGAPHRHPLAHALTQLRDDLVPRRELADRRALAAGDDERVDVVELLGSAHIDRVRADAAQRAQVFGEVALETEDADARVGCCLTA